MTKPTLYNLKGLLVMNPDNTTCRYLADVFVDEVTYLKTLARMVEMEAKIVAAVAAFRELKPIDVETRARLEAEETRVARMKVWKPGDTYVPKPSEERWIHASTPLKPVPCVPGFFAYSGMGSGTYHAADGSRVYLDGASAWERAKAEGVPFVSVDVFNCELVLAE